MAKKMAEPGITEPTLESRVSGLEYRAAHPNHRSLATMLENPEDAQRFRDEFDRCCFDRDVVLWNDNREWPRAQFAETAGSAKWAPMTWAIILGALLGAALALGALAILNPEVFHRPTNEIPVTASNLKSPTNLTVTPSTNAVSSGETEHFHSPPSSFKALRIRVATDCWVEITDTHDKIIFQHVLDSTNVVNFQPDWPVTVRSGCPNAIHYELDGTEVYPTNQSQKPDKSEVVALP